jgi:hypothetical protein
MGCFSDVVADVMVAVPDISERVAQPGSARTASIEQWLTATLSIKSADASLYAKELRRLGVDSVEDLSVLESEDLASFMKPVHRRKLEGAIHPEGEGARAPGNSVLPVDKMKEAEQEQVEEQARR